MACKLRLATKFNTVPRIMLALKEKYSFSFWIPSPFPPHSHPWQKKPNTHIQNPKKPAQEPIEIASIGNLNSHYSFVLLGLGA